MVGENFGVTTMGSSTVSHEPEDFGTGKSAFTTLCIVSHSPNSKNVPNTDPRKPQKYDFPWFAKFTMQATPRGRRHGASDVGDIVFLRVAYTKS